MYREMITAVLNKISVDDAETVINGIDTLKRMGLIANNIRVEKKDKYVEYAGVLIDKKEKLADIINKVMESSHVPAKDDELTDMQKTIKVGTEFTFRKETFLFSMDDLAIEIGGAHKGEIEDAGSQIKNWTDYIMGLKGKNVKGIRVKDVCILTASKKHRSPYYDAVKLELTLQDLASAPETWWINFDLDPMCIEIQAEPKPYSFYETYINFINEVLFNNSQCKPDKNPKTGGGGHISLDYASAFLDTPCYLKNFLVKYASITAKRNSNVLIKSADVDNAPFMYEIKELDDFVTQIRAFNGLEQKDATIEALADRISNYVYKKMTQTLRDMGVKDSDAKHYQAVNLEHVYLDNPKNRRVEMRRFDAQENVNDLLEELDALYDIIQETRTCFKLNINKDTYEVFEEKV